jgi:hypothetical protein
MPAQPTQQYLEELIRLVEDLEIQFKTLNAVIVQLQAERDAYRELALGLNRG